MNNFFKSMLGINLPTADEVVQQAKTEAIVEEAQAQAAAAAQEGPQAIAMTQFVLLSDGTMNLRMQWLDESIPAATVFGEFLFRIHSGRFKASSVDLLMQMQKNNIKNKPFIEAVCKRWQELMNEEDNEPLVHPLNVFGVTRGQDND